MLSNVLLDKHYSQLEDREQNYLTQIAKLQLENYKLKEKIKELEGKPCEYIRKII